MGQRIALDAHLAVSPTTIHFEHVLQPTRPDLSARKEASSPFVVGLGEYRCDPAITRVTEKFLPSGHRGKNRDVRIGGTPMASQRTRIDAGFLE